jgi:alkylation response protein AidB-like acyl-CoA dehydrogenase
MGIGISEEHEALRASARQALARHCPPAVPRAWLDASAESLPEFWPAIAELGWLGLHIGEEHGGSGYGLPELVVVCEELGYAAAPGPFLPTVLAAALIALGGDDELLKELLPGLVDGSTPAAVAFASEPLTAASDGDDLRVSGVVRPVPAAATAELVVVPVTTAKGVVWCVVDAAGTVVAPVPSLDQTRRLATVELDGVAVPPSRQLRLDDGVARDLATVLLGAEACGVAAWCLDTAVAYAKVREQFGRPIGQFQAVKHRLADLLVAVEQARAVVWDAARADVSTDDGRFAVAVAAVLAPDAAARAGKDCVQILGGIGYTWEHDAHIYLKRAMALRQLAGSAATARARVAALAMSGVRRALDVALPEEAERHRSEVREFLDGLVSSDKAGWDERLASSGYLVPHYPKPYGLGADPLQQIVIDEEFRRARVRRRSIAVGAWALPTLIAHGTPEQQERWVRPTLRGELWWCQMFSEPGAGSDLAALSTKAERVEGGWKVTGQKVWTSLAQQATHAILLARTSGGTADDRRAGITYFILDMQSPGIEIRPLRELTGLAMFNEVFLSDVFIPDDSVVGAVGDGWRLARTTLANERVSMGTGASFGAGIESLVEWVTGSEYADDAVTVGELGGFVAEAQSLAGLTLRTTMRALSGAEPGPESSLKKLLGVEHDQRVQEFGLQLLGAEGATTDGVAAQWTGAFLATRCLTIAGGTSEVQRNVIAERLLGLPRDPEPPPGR